MEHRGPEILEQGDLGVDFLADGEGEVHPAALDDDVDVAAGAAEEAVAHVAADYEGADPALLRGFRNNPEDRAVKISFRYRLHISSYVGRWSTATTPSPSRLKQRVWEPLVISI